MAIYQLYKEQKLPAEVEAVWDFISSPGNLKNITPPHMGFDITSEKLPEKMHPGMIIMYNVTPVFGIKLKWVTEITHVVDKQYFVDEQRVGPYAIWHHKHFVKEIDHGTEMIDIVHYQLPFPLIANRFHGLLVKPKLKEIFAYRTAKLFELFGEYK